MGLLDALFSGGSGGGLLDFLQSSGMSQQPMQGLPSDQAQYGQPMNAMAQMQPPIFQQNQPNPMDAAQWPVGPVGAPSQANAQMPPQQPPPVIQQQPQAPAQPQDSGLGIGDRLGMGFRGMAANMAGGPIGALMGGIAGVSGMGQGNSANVTAKALLAKGVDPLTVQAAISNPELMKTLITQTYGPQTVQSLGEGYVADKTGKVTRAYQPEKTPMSIGNGYIYDPRTKQTTRAYEPEDKIPAGFVKGDDGNMHYIPGGPADPAYIQLAEAKKKDPNGVYTLGRGGELYKVDKDGNPVIVHKNQEAGGDAASIDDKTATLLANRLLAGDTKALVGLGRGAQGAANILKIHKMASDIADEKGIDAKAILNNAAQQAGLVSSARALGTKETHFGVAEKAMEESLPLAQAASNAVPRSDWIHLNKLVQAGQTEHANPLLKRFLIATDTAAKDYARTINPTGALRESDIEYARKILSTADGPDAYTAALDQLKMEAGVMHRAIQRQKGELYGSKKEAGKSEAVKIDGYTITAH